MAIQAQVYQENVGFPWLGDDMNVANTIHSENQSGCGLNLSFNPQLSGFQQKQLEQQGLYRQLQLQLQMSRTHPQSLSAHISQQGKEFDQMLQFQNQRLRMALQEQRKQQISEMMKKIEWKAQFILSQKDQEIARATQRTAELHDLLQKMEMESQAWQRVAQENEAIVASLNNTIDELMRDRACSSSAACGADAAAVESCCDENKGYRIGRSGQACFESTDNGAMNPCKSCHSRGSCMLFLPCRHLCTCKECEAILGFCPVCKTAKKATVEAYIS